MIWGFETPAGVSKPLFYKKNCCSRALVNGGFGASDANDGGGDLFPAVAAADAVDAQTGAPLVALEGMQIQVIIPNYVDMREPQYDLLEIWSKYLMF